MSIKGFSVGGNVERYDYNALDNIPSEITIDTALSDSSTNPVQNRVVTSAINSANGSISSISGDVDDLKSAISLHDDEIDNTVQTITFGSDGSVQKIEHKRNNVIIRTDTFTFATNMITEVTTLNTGETLTIATNLTTLETTVTYAAA